jgi:heat shock protein HslJ/membrane-bound inhibitor of C-type lysozyme
MGLACALGAQAQLRYACPSGEVFHVAVHKGETGREGYAVVLVEGKPPIVLRQAVAASGARYTDGFTVLWTKGNEAMIESGTIDAKGCAGSMTGRSLSGTFVYMADAASFTDCATGRRVPVAMEGGYVEVERAYAEKRSAPGAPVFVTVLGRIENKPKMEGPGTQPTLVVEKLESMDASKSCAAGAPGLTGKWTLTQLRGKEVKVKRAPNLEFLAQGGRAAGFGGCNRLTSSYTVSGTTLRFKGAASTMMACPGEEMALERDYSKALSEVASYQVAGAELKMMGAGGEVLAVFRKE